MSSNQPVVLGEGAMVLQTVDADLVRQLKAKWVQEGKIEAAADDAAVLRAFVEQFQDQTLTPGNYVVQRGDTWASIASKLLGSQTRYKEIMSYNQMPSHSFLLIGQKLRIPS